MDSRAPEQIIRDWLEANGPVEVGLAAFEQTWGVERLSVRHRREVVEALASVGVSVEPNLDYISRRDKVLLSVTGPATEVVEPEHEEPETDYVEHEPEPVEPVPRRHRRRGRIWTPGPEEPFAPEPAPLQQVEPEQEPETQPVTPAAGRLGRTPRAVWILAAGAALMILGSLGPWGKAVFVTDYGLDRSGALVMLAALLASVALGLYVLHTRRTWLGMLAAAVAALSAAMIASDFRDLVDDPFVRPDWGLYMAFAGCAVIVGLSMALLARPGTAAANGDQGRPAATDRPDHDLQSPL